MIAPNVVITALLAGTPNVVAFTADRIYSPRLMPGWKPAYGPAISHFVRGGPAPGLYTPIDKPSIQVTAWAATPKLARQTHDAVYKAIHGLEDTVITTPDGDVRILVGKAESFPQDVVDPETGWFTVTNFFAVDMQL